MTDTKLSNHLIQHASPLVLSVIAQKYHPVCQTLYCHSSNVHRSLTIL